MKYKASGNDNALALGQTVRVPQGRYFSVHMLASSETGLANGFVNATYSDKTTTSGPVLVSSWYRWPYPAGGDIVLPYYYTNETINYNRSMIFETINWLDSTKELVSLTLPNVTAGAMDGPKGTALDTRLHLFSLSLLPAVGSAMKLDIQYVRSTQLWMPGTNKTQIVEVVVNNVGSEWVLANNSVKITVSSSGCDTVVLGVINMLAPGNQAKAQVGVENKGATTTGTTGNATVSISGIGVSASYAFNATFGVVPYEATYDSVYAHESPSWYNDLKYGIFIHWNGWYTAQSSWILYWWDQNQGPNQTTETYQYDLATYGPDHVYDDFVQNFTADAFDPKAWVSKHHDGYAIFDLPANVSLRTSVAQFPHRNLLKELFDAAAQYQPHLHRGTYFSLPEWFNPAYAPYGFAQWPGGNATNPYTNATLPYTGFVPVNDYVQDVILPEMNTLAEMGTEIMWCDIGGPNLTAEFASAWFNTAADRNCQVVMDNRCGLPEDFDTPEYARYDAVQVRKWESNLGMDPFSYGYNRATPGSAYLKAVDIVTSLIDIVSKNGDFLLDVGPQANGTIIAIEQQNLRQAGVWIRSHGEAIFNTTYWFVTPQEGTEIRFTQTMDAFYITRSRSRT
ncbi:hypothetical protein LTR04_005540 [Oleoguttula sp. CCFEE 6159]|nr:hypothetical protein LTR04_005540 [Oleoguttula sp. CCFEE 6159]